ncbi:PucR family transcriptional regulator [Fretibacterium fastidiosum]|uniref:Sugar diacid utilization regulator n=1 Tax=Fretibacterium fastidiosum TaxID=651822 RepID=A0AB94IWJ0_9BACT|nr:helix-turn-helix domain-containing protein [Fretibacterium fastidiosum]CBL28089.1 hypothetical protein SY1_07670 [Fretibacterium fastidiosum]
MKRSLSDFVPLLLKDEGLPEIIDEIRAELSFGVAWRELDTGNVLCRGNPAFEERMLSFPLREIVRIYVSHEVEVSGNAIGLLVLDLPKGLPGPLPERLEDCLSVLRLFYGQRLAESRLKTRYRNEFVQDLIYGRIYHEEEIRNRARTFHWKLDGGIVCLVISPELTETTGAVLDEALLSGFNLIQSRVLAFFPKSVYARLPDSLVVVLTLALPEERGRETRLRDFRAALREVMENALHDARDRCRIRFFASVGSWREKPILAYQSYQEARQALMILRGGMSRQDFVFWEQLGGTRMIAMLADMEPAREFCRQTLAPLLRESRGGEELIHTLLRVEECGGDLRQAAKSLSLHYNTLRYRLRRIQEILDLSPHDGERRFNLSLALRLHRVLSKNRTA